MPSERAQSTPLGVFMTRKEYELHGAGFVFAPQHQSVLFVSSLSTPTDITDHRKSSISGLLVDARVYYPHCPASGVV